jgi:prefoldin subunit 5
MSAEIRNELHERLEQYDKAITELYQRIEELEKGVNKNVGRKAKQE